MDTRVDEGAAHYTIHKELVVFNGTIKLAKTREHDQGIPAMLSDLELPPVPSEGETSVDEPQEAAMVAQANGGISEECEAKKDDQRGSKYGGKRVPISAPTATTAPDKVTDLIDALSQLVAEKPRTSHRKARPPVSYPTGGHVPRDRIERARHGDFQS